MRAVEAFPNYMQLPQRLPIRAWYALRALSVVAALGLCVLLVARPRDGLTIWWGVAIPAAAAALLGRARHLAQHLPAGGLEPDAARASASPAA